MPPRTPGETKHRLQEAAEREFARYGFAGGRVARIARAARTNQRMVYHYFGGKQGLYDAVRYHVGDELAEGRLRDDLTPMIGLSLAAIVSVMYPLMLREQWLRTATLSDVGVDEPDSA